MPNITRYSLSILILTFAILSFSCSKEKSTEPQNTSTVTDIDGNIYHTVTIGSQVWMVENLKTTHYRNGDSILNVTDNNIWYNAGIGIYSDYNNDTANGDIYGRLYNWLAVSDSRGLAPLGWHVASDSEWQTLVDCFGGDIVAGDKLKEDGTVHWNAPNSGNNETGFTGLPGGSRQYGGEFMDLGVYGTFMTSTETSSEYVWVWSLYNQTGYVQHGGAYKPYGFSVRCVKD